MCSLLIVFLLVIETSAAQDIERPSRGFGDSVQICSNERGVWRIRTHAADRHRARRRGSLCRA